MEGSAWSLCSTEHHCIPGLSSELRCRWGVSRIRSLSWAAQSAITGAYAPQAADSAPEQPAAAARAAGGGGSGQPQQRSLVLDMKAQIALARLGVILTGEPVVQPQILQRLRPDHIEQDLRAHSRFLCCACL